jgi:N6-adenosine-specific RNA methylase IME4
MPLIHKNYNLIVIDPPWPLQKTGNEKDKARGKTRELDYSLMTLWDIQSLPIESLAPYNKEEACHLFVWTTQKYLLHALQFIETWGFSYLLTITWDKKNGICVGGFHFRTEFIVVGRRGKKELFKKGQSIPSYFFAKSFFHSQKPQEFYTMVEPLGDRRLDIFARKQRPGWDVMGNEINGKDIRITIKEHLNS